MGNFIAVFVLATLIGFAVGYVYRRKKKGTKCIGCPYSDGCGKHFCCGKE